MWFLAAATAVLAVGCGTGASHGSGPASVITEAPRPATASATATAGGLTVTLTAAPSRATHGGNVAFTATAHETHAPGALGYQLSYGDGATDQNAVAQFCRAEPAGPTSETWPTKHAYRASGTYTVVVTVRANCTSDRATASLSITVT